MTEPMEIDVLLQKNRAWAERVRSRDPEFFDHLAQSQAPAYLWIGCSDSRVPPSEIMGLQPGELFVHRNIANVVAHSDLNCLSVLQYAIDVLKVRHVLVVGHLGCGGVRAALQGTRVGLIDSWLQHIRDVADKHRDSLDLLPDETARVNRLCELNAVEQAVNVCRTTVVRDAWSRGQKLSVHAWVYNLCDGLVLDLGFSVEKETDLQNSYLRTIRA